MSEQGSMSFLVMIGEARAEADVDPNYQGDIEGGLPPQLLAALPHSPRGLPRMTRLDRRQRTTDGRGSLRATVGAASRPRSTYCSLADDKIQADMFYQPAEVRDMVEGPDASVLEAVDTLVFEMAGRVADDATTERARHRDDAHGRPR